MEPLIGNNGGRKAQSCSGSCAAFRLQLFRGRERFQTSAADEESVFPLDLTEGKK